MPVSATSMPINAHIASESAALGTLASWSTAWAANADVTPAAISLAHGEATRSRIS